MVGRWADVTEAARELEISTDAVRKRIARGSLESSREDGHVLVWLDDGGTEAGREAQVDREALVEVLSEQVAYLKEQLNVRTEELREHRRIIAALTQRIPELEPPSEQEAPKEPPGGPQSAGAGSNREETPPRGFASDGAQEDAREPRSWWRRMFGG
jgi:hypothetical protein